jgi:hypothetical protein
MAVRALLRPGARLRQLPRQAAATAFTTFAEPTAWAYAAVVQGTGLDKFESLLDNHSER